MAMVQLRIRIDGFRRAIGSCPLHRPNRRQMAETASNQSCRMIDAIGRDTYRYAGCRDGDTEQAYVNTQNQLTLVIAGQSFKFTQPKMKPNDADDKNAPPMRWFLPRMIRIPDYWESGKTF